MANMKNIRRRLASGASAAALVIGLAGACLGTSEGVAHAQAVADLRCYHWMFGDGAPGEVKTTGGYTVVCEGSTGTWRIEQAPESPSWSLGGQNGATPTGPVAPRAVTVRS